MRLANRIVSLLIIAFGVFVTIEAFKLKIMVNGSIGAGFFPLCIGILFIVLAIIPFIRSFPRFSNDIRKLLEKNEIRTFSVVIGSSIVMMVLTPWLGLTVSLGIMAGAMSKLLGTKSWISAAVLGVFTSIFVYVLFGVLLGVSLPKGIFQI